MQTLIRRVAVAITALACLAGAAPASATTVFQYVSQGDPSQANLREDSAGDPVGKGGSGTITDADGTFAVADASPGHIGLTFTAPGISANFDFSVPSGTLAVGNYPQATIYGPRSGNGIGFPGDSSYPGLYVGGFVGVGCSTLSGSFVISELTFGPGNTLQSFAVDFVQHCLHIQPALYGAIRYNSSVPIALTPPPPPDPAWIRMQSTNGASYSTNEADGVTFWLGAWRFTEPYGGLDGSVTSPGDGLGYKFQIPYGGFTPGAYSYNDSNMLAVVVALNPATWSYGSTLLGCSPTKYSYTVLEVEAAPSASYSKLALDFVQTCADQTVYGAIRYNSSIPYTAPIFPNHTERVSSTPPTAPYGGTVQPFVSRAVDANGSAAPGASVTFASTCGTFNGASSVTVTADGNGLATSPSFIAGNATGQCTVTSRIPGGSTDSSQDFQVGIYNPASVRVLGVGSISLTVGQSYSFALTVTSDLQQLPGNPISFSVLGSGAAQPASLPTGVTTGADGNVLITLQANGSPGQYQIKVTSGSASLIISVTQFAQVTTPPPPFSESVLLQDMWWSGTSQNGWGFSIVQHGDTLFGALYVYDASGKPTWFVMPGGSWDSTGLAYRGSLYEPAGSPYYAYDAAKFAAGNAIGTIAIEFQDANNAVLDYTIDGVAGTKSVTREIFANGPATGADHSDLWWGGASQNGWGITVLQQATTLFAVWYTYDSNGKPLWYVMPGGAWNPAGDTYSGTLYRTTGAPWLGASYDPSKLDVITAGTYSFRFSGDGATFTYTADGHSGSIPLVREPF